MAASEMIKFVDVTKCIGCKACTVACKSWNDLAYTPEEYTGSYQSHKELTAETWNFITFKEVPSATRDFGFEWLMGHKSCMHCEDAGCEKACPEEAISHNKFGSVVIDHEKCVGCGYCVPNCPFNVIKLGERTVNGKKKLVSNKCNHCESRLEGGEVPACVRTCPSDSLEYGKRDEIMAKANERLNVIKARFPNAHIYDVSGVGSTKTVYLLADKPEHYDLPSNPKLPTSLTVWKDYAQPAGKFLFGATTMAVVAGVISNKLLNSKAKAEETKAEEVKGGQAHE